MADAHADLINQPHSLSSLLATACEHKIKLTITTIDGNKTTGIPLHGPLKEDGILTLEVNDSHRFLATRHIVKIAPREDSRMYAL